MSSADDDDCMIKLDANIEIETIVRNHFEEDPSYFEIPENNLSIFFDEDLMASSEHSQASTSKISKDTENVASGSSDVSDNMASAISDVSADSGDSMTIDATPEEEVVQEKEAPIESFSSFKNVNVKERIVFCIDMSTDMEKVPFITKETELSPLSMIKRVIGIFVQNKHFVDKKHEYSLMVLYDTATWVCEFTNNTRKLMDALADLTETLECTSCDLASVILLLTEKYPLVLSTNPADFFCLYRIILIYGRSSCMIHLSDPSVRKIILDSNTLYLDVLYIHEPQSETNHCLDIYEYFCNLDDRDKSYIFEMTRSVSNLHSFMGKLLSHPFQRALQKNANYRLRDIVQSDT